MQAYPDHVTPKGATINNCGGQLVSAAILEKYGILPRGTAFRMEKLGLIPSYAVGVKGRGVRFRVAEVLDALHRPKPEAKDK